MPAENITKEGYLHENYHYFHLHDTAGQERSFHYHEFDKIVILKSGKVNYTVEDITYTLSPMTVLLVRHHAIHRALIDVSEPYDRIIIYLDRKYFDKALPGTRLMECFDATDQPGKCLLLPDKKECKALEDAIRAYEAEINDTEYAADALRDTLMLQLLIAINRISASSKGSDTADVSYDDKVRATLSYINEHLTEELTVDTLAANVYLSRYYFMRLFKNQTGSTVHAYIRQKRLLYAARLIREGKPVGSAAAESGFADYSVFNRAFRECFGIKPSELK